MPRWDSDGRARICLIPMPRFSRMRVKARDAGFYIAGALFALGWWFFIDAAVYSKNWNYDNGSKYVSIEFVDWVPGICSTVGMIIIDCIDKASLREDSFSSYNDGISAVWRARLFLFIGFAFMAGGLAGSVSIMCIKYLIPDYGDAFTFWGICIVVQNSLIMASTAILFVVETARHDNPYSLSI